MPLLMTPQDAMLAPWFWTPAATIPSDSLFARVLVNGAQGDFATIVKTLQRYPPCDVNVLLCMAAAYPPCSEVLAGAKPIE
eukprot:359786-Chlamydomonas_euryale.AAC.6